jgi:hypothetical protein
MIMTEDNDLRTETVSNPRGWAAVRVTHIPTGTIAERVRSDSLKSAVEAQRECIAEIKDHLVSKSPAAPGSACADPQSSPKPLSDPAEAPVTRVEFDALVARVRRLEETLDEGPARRTVQRRARSS